MILIQQRSVSNVIIWVRSLNDNTLKVLRVIRPSCYVYRSYHTTVVKLYAHMCSKHNTVTCSSGRSGCQYNARRAVFLEQSLRSRFCVDVLSVQAVAIA
jgi:hypothetical protein